MIRTSYQPLKADLRFLQHTSQNALSGSRLHYRGCILDNQKDWEGGRLVHLLILGLMGER